MKTKTLSITVKPQITYDHFESVMVGALEGGSNYWYFLNEIDLSKREKDQPYSEYLSQRLFNDPFYKLNIYDAENPDELLGTVTQKSMLNAFKLAFEKYPNHYHDLMEGQDDCDTADVFFQLAVMGEVVFG